MRSSFVALAAAGFLVLSGCATTTEKVPHELTRHTWNLIQIAPRDAGSTILTYPQQARHQLLFEMDGELLLTLDCNRGNANWSADDPRDGSGSLEIGIVASTRALCPSPTFGEQLAADLPSARSFSLQSGGQSMTISTRQNDYTFVAAEGMSGNDDALVPGTKYHATTEIPCSFNRSYPSQRCPAGVIRRWGEDGTTLVEVVRPNGLKRALFFNGTHAYGADSAQSDGSAAYKFEARRRGDETIISYGPESYVVPDALVVGG